MNHKKMSLILSMAIIFTLLVPASSASSASGSWVGEGPGTLTVSDGSTSDPALHYELNPGDHDTKWWQLNSTATDTNYVTVQWEDTGSHAWYDVQVELVAFVTRNGEKDEVPILNESPSGDFSYKGTYSFKLYAGDEYGFEFGGSNFDSNNFLTGTLVVNPLWLGDGLGTVTVSDGSTSDPSLQYSLNPAGLETQQWWWLYTLATSTRQVMVQWEYTGIHAWYKAHVNLVAYITRADVTSEVPILDESMSGDFSYKGTYTFDLLAGDLYGFKFGGSNDDINNFLNGTLVVHPLWDGDGPGTFAVSVGTTSFPQLQYSLNPAGLETQQWWRFCSSATSTHQALVKWEYTGIHAWFKAHVNLVAFITRGFVTNEVPILDESMSGDFSYKGTYTFDLQAGDLYGFKFGGSNNDINNFLNGTLVVHPLTTKTYLPAVLRAPYKLIGSV